MQLVIDEVEYKDPILIVIGKTPAGTVKGIWKDKKVPVIGEGYHVELSIDKPKEIKSVNPNSYSSVFVDNNNVIFIGLCEDMDDEVYYLRFGLDWLEMLDIDVIIDRKKKGDYISFSVNWRDIVIYPYD